MTAACAGSTLPCHRRPGHRRTTLARLLCCASLSSVPLYAHAELQTAVHDLGIDGVLTASDNAMQAPPGQESGELLLTVTPHVRASWQGDGLQVDLNASASVHAETGGSRPRRRNRLALDLSSGFKATLVERLLTLDGELRMRDAPSDPYQPVFRDAASIDRRTEVLARLSPQFTLLLDQDSTLRATSDLTLVDNAAGSGARRTTHTSNVRYDRDPRPTGLLLELSRTDSDTDETSGDGRYHLTSARAGGSLLVAEGLRVEASIGHDQGGSQRGAISRSAFGLGLRWVPGPRSLLDAVIERRFFGIGGSVELRHRLPWLALNLRLSRKPGVVPIALDSAPQAGDLRVLLDSMLTTREPDPAQRRTRVDELIDQRGLEPGTADPIDQVANYPQLQTRLDAGAALLRRRSTLSLGVYAQSARAIDFGGPVAPTANLADTRQYGVSAQFSHLLTPQLSATVSVNWSRVDGIGARSGNTSEQHSLRAHLQQQLAPGTTLLTGVERRQFETNVAGRSGFTENRIFAGISHRF